MNYVDFLKGMNNATEIWKKEAEKWVHKRAKEIIEEESEKFDTLIEIQNYMIDKQAQDERWKALTEDGRQARIASYNELLKLQKEEANSYLITIEDLEKLYGKHNLNPQPLTYEDVARELFEKSGLITYGIGEEGEIFYFNWSSRYDYIKSNQPNLCTSRKQAEKLIAINRLLNVAKFLNKDWKPDWSNYKERKWHLELFEDEIKTSFVWGKNYSFVYFRTEELAKQAIQILGANTVRLALTTEY